MLRHFKSSLLPQFLFLFWMLLATIWYVRRFAPAFVPVVRGLLHKIWP